MHQHVTFHRNVSPKFVQCKTVLIIVRRWA